MKSHFTFLTYAYRSFSINEQAPFANILNYPFPETGGGIDLNGRMIRNPPSAAAFVNRIRLVAA